MRELWRSFLSGRKQVRVQTNLENRTSLGLTRQFRIDHFVRPATERAWLFHPSENIGTATPLPGAPWTITGAPAFMASKVCATASASTPTPSIVVTARPFALRYST